MDQLRLVRGEGKARVVRWHALGGVLGRDPTIDFALGGLAGHRDSEIVTFGEDPFAGVETEIGLSLGLVRSVTVITEIGEDRTDVAIEINGLGEYRISRGQRGG